MPASDEKGLDNDKRRQRMYPAWAKKYINNLGQKDSRFVLNNLKKKYIWGFYTYPWKMCKSCVIVKTHIVIHSHIDTK